MKKKLITLALLSGLSTTASADMIGTYFGADIWQSGVDGTLKYNSDEFSTSYEDTYNYRAYIKVEHPFPLIPNASIRFSNVDVTAEGSNSSNEQSINLQTIDYTLYYEFLDNSIVSLDAGLTLRQLKGTYIDKSGSLDIDESFEAPLPMGYVSAEVGMPMFPLKGFAMVNAVGLSGDVYGDAEVGLAFMLNPGYVLDWSLRAGYRMQKLDLGDIDNVTADVTIDGVFFGIEGHI